MKICTMIAALLLTMMTAVPALGFTLTEDGTLGLDEREAALVRTICAGVAPVCTIFHMPTLLEQLKVRVQKAYEDGRQAEREAKMRSCRAPST